MKFLQVPHFENRVNFRKHIVGKAEASSSCGEPKYENLKKLLGIVCLRRMTSVVALHGLEFSEHRLPFSETERTIYNRMAELCTQHIDLAVSSQGSRHGSEAILVGLLRLRMFCSSGIGYAQNLNVGNSVVQLGPDEMISLLQQDGRAICTECGCDILAAETTNSSGRQAAISRTHLRCQDCTLVNAGRPNKDISHIKGRIGCDDNAVRDAQDKGPKILNHGHNGPFSDSESLSGDCVFSAKLNSLLADVKEHYFHDKRYLHAFLCVVRRLIWPASSSQHGKKV
jgi:SWI/SNF-related matrix-associated actin-dependent regulator of chromatin subfamily A3